VCQKLLNSVKAFERYKQKYALALFLAHAVYCLGAYESMQVENLKIATCVNIIAALLPVKCYNIESKKK